MAIPTVTLAENAPAGGAYVRDGNDRIMEYKIQNREILEVDHFYPSSGQSDSCGRHKQMTLIEAADIGTGGAGVPILGAQTANGKPELVFTDEDDTDVQITKAGLLNLDDVTLASLAVLMAFVYPIGCIYTTTVATNPATVLGFGTWAAFGAGKVLVGFNAAETEFDVVEETGGEKTHVLTTAELAAHTHAYSLGDTPGGAQTMALYATNASGSGITGSAGSGTAHNNLQPYIVVYFWKRTA